MLARLKQATSQQHPPTSPILSSSNWPNAAGNLSTQLSALELDSVGNSWPQPQQYPINRSATAYEALKPQVRPVRAASPVRGAKQYAVIGQPLATARSQNAIERRLAFELPNTPNSADVLMSYLQRCADHEPYMTQAQVRPQLVAVYPVNVMSSAQSRLCTMPFEQ